MPKDINSLDDIRILVTNFYAKVRKDDLIGYIFNDVADIHWESHLEKISHFWESVLFGTASYKGNPMLKHIELNKKEPLKTSHFERWLHLWKETTNELYQGPKTEEAKIKAESLKNLMIYKIKAHSGTK